MPEDQRAPDPRRRPASPAADVGRPPRRIPAWVGALALLTALTSTACDDGGGSGGADGAAPDAAEAGDADRPDGMPPDAAPDAAPDGMPPDAAPDGMPADAAPPQAVTPAVVAGGAAAESGRYRLRLSVGGPSPTHVTSSDRLRGRIGVALPLPAPEEQAR